MEAHQINDINMNISFVISDLVFLVDTYTFLEILIFTTLCTQNLILNYCIWSKYFVDKYVLNSRIKNTFSTLITLLFIELS